MQLPRRTSLAGLRVLSKVNFIDGETLYLVESEPGSLAIFCDHSPISKSFSAPAELDQCMAAFLTLIEAKTARSIRSEVTARSRRRLPV